MSNEEHTVENIICYVQNVGWQNIDLNHPNKHKCCCYPEELPDETFAWLLRMAVYVVYYSTVVGVDFSNEGTEVQQSTEGDSSQSS